jgi:hypothetical protein
MSWDGFFCDTDHQFVAVEPRCAISMLAQLLQNRDMMRSNGRNDAVRNEYALDVDMRTKTIRGRPRA